MNVPTVGSRCQIEVEQAVFASADRRNVRGYQLVARSAGIDPTTAIEITRWAPTQLPDDAPHNWTISAWTLASGNLAIARTITGGPEYSDRGGAQIVTMLLVLTPEQFLGYDCNAILVARTALALGYLRYTPALVDCELPVVSLPGSPTVRPVATAWSRLGAAVDGTLATVAQRVRETRRVAVIGTPDPVIALESLISRLTIEPRRRLSFTIGLSPSIRRELQAHFYRRPDTARLQALQSEGIECFHVRQRPSDSGETNQAWATVSESGAKNKPSRLIPDGSVIDQPVGFVES